ncbi:hypothetical protein B0H13DRAFT_2285643 [Mycena leptocephala]|nr:hypothetical protein B0H13DRAFT_2285643 [Mycena leptocephala]
MPGHVLFELGLLGAAVSCTQAAPQTPNNEMPRLSCQSMTLMHIDPLKQVKSGYLVFVERPFTVVVLFLPVIVPVRPQPNSLTDKSRRIISQNNTHNSVLLDGHNIYLIIWASRLSILFSIIRIEPSAERRRLLFWVAATFVAAALLLLGQMFWICESNPSWKNFESVRYYAYVACVKADVISDSILLLAPLPLFRKLINKSLGYKLTIMFSSCVVTTIVSLVHAVFILTHYDTMIFISAIVEIQACLSLIVANIPVIITTTIDIVGEPDQAQIGKSVQLTSVFWFTEAQTTGAIELHTITEDPAKLSYAKNAAASAWNQNDLPLL